MGGGQPFHYESMKWSQLKKNPKVKTLIIEIDNHNAHYTRSMHSYDLRYENEGKIWSLEYWKLIQSHQCIPMIWGMKMKVKFDH